MTADLTEETEPAAIAVVIDDGTDGAVSVKRPCRLELTSLARGPWRPDAAHGGAPAALLVREIERHCDDGALRIASLSFTFLGPVMLGEVEVVSSVVKPGRRQKVVVGGITSGDRTLITVRAVLLRR